MIVINPAPRTHLLKTHPGPYWAVVEGSKMFEVRKDDRNFHVGDRLVLREWDEDRGYSGQHIEVRVTYYLPGGVYGLPKNLCVMWIKR